LIEVVGRVVDGATDSGKCQAPVLVDDIMDGYLLDVRPFLEKEANNITKLLGSIKGAAPRENAQIKRFLDKLEQVVANWSRIAQPIQMSLKPRGMAHDIGKDIGFKIRNMAIELCNSHDEIKEAQFITDLLRRYFSQFPELMELQTEDALRLAKIIENRSQAELLKQVHLICREAAEAAQQFPLDAEKHGQNIITAAPKLLVLAESSGVPIEFINSAKDHIAFAICACAVLYAKKTARWRPCLVLLDAANSFAVGEQAKTVAEKQLQIVKHKLRMYGDIEPISTAPSLSTVYGFGRTLYGKSDLDTDSGSYMATCYFVLLFLPIFPICRYRVIYLGPKRYSFLGRGPLRAFDIMLIPMSVIFILNYFFRH
jgi:hypothetical protein